MTAALRSFWAAPAVAAALLWAAFAPVDLGVAAIAGWTVLFTSMRVRGGERAGRQAFAGHFAFFLAGLWWIAPLVSAGWVFVAAWCAAFEGLFARCLVGALRRARDEGDARWVVAAPLLHLAFDMVRTVLFTGFPWLLTGYAGWRNPVLIGSADLLGVHGATAATLLLAAGLAEAWARRIEGRGAPPLRPLVPAAVVWAALGAWALVKPAPEARPGPTLLLLQASIDQKLKEDLGAGERQHVAEDYWRAHEEVAAAGLAEAAAAGRRVDAVVWAETMVPGEFPPPAAGTPLRHLHPNFEERRWELRDETRERVVAAAGGRPTLAGVVVYDPRSRRRRNSSVLLDGSGRVLGRQDKQHLTPGGETLLFLDWLPSGLREDLANWLTEWAGFVPDLEAGEGASLVPLPGGDGTTTRLGVLICYESIFPELSREMVRGGADALVNLSNYGWFTGTPQMEQALAMAAFRAAELRRAVVLCSNNGVSAVIGPDGRVGPRTQADRRTHLLADVPVARGTTVFARVGEAGAWALGAVGAAILLRRRRRASSQVSETS